MGNSFSTTTASGSGTDYGTYAGVLEKADGIRNLEAYFRYGGTGSSENTSVQNQITDSVADRLTEANADMQEAFLEWQGPDYVTLGHFTTSEQRWLTDTAEYGALVKGWSGNNVGRAQTDAVPQQIATAMNEWQARLQKLATGAVLRRYYASESGDDDRGILELQEDLGPEAKFRCPTGCEVYPGTDDYDCN